MVTIDWDRVLSINPMSLKGEEIEDIYPMVTECDVEEVSNIHNLKALFKVSQEILQYKDNQVESLLIECDELKEKTLMGKELSPAKQKSGRKLEVIDESGIDSQRDSGYEESVQEMLREKNYKIETLMQELEGLEQDNAVLKDNLTLLKDEMEDATEKMNEMTDELTTLRDNVNIFKDKSVQLERENRALLSQIEELAAQQLERDKLIDDFGAAIDARIVEWKSILDEKNTEIALLRKNLSETLLSSATLPKGQSLPQIISLNEEIDNRDKIIAELQSKLSEAVTEINEGCSVIEKLKSDVKSTEGLGRKKEQRDLLKKYQAANEKIHSLQNLLETAENDARVKSKELCEALAIIRKYEDQDQGLTETLHELKEVKDRLNHKNEYIKDLVNVINKLEMLNSQQELEIIALREKLGISDDEVISVDHIIQRQQEEQKKIQELEYLNKVLKEENLELKSDIRTLKFKLRKLAAKFVGQNGTSVRSDTVDNPVGSATSLSKSDDFWTAEREKEWLADKIEISKMKENVQIIIEENEALRKGMHEILDSIRNQDAKSIVEIQSDTLERLLEALDVRHLAGWYHPAMRLQERLNVVQGINNELRTQLKEMRKEVKKKDILLQRAGIDFTFTEEKSNVEESEAEESKVNVSEVEKLQEAYQNDLEEWQKQTDSLRQENTDLKDMIVKLEVKIQEYENNWNLLDLSEEDIRTALAAKSKEYVEATMELSMANRKCIMLEELLSKESNKLYNVQKETIAKESNLQKDLADSEKRIKLLESQVSMLQSNLLNSVSILQYNELNEKYVECNIRLRAALEDRVLQRDKHQTVTHEKYQEPDKLEVEPSKVEKNDSNQLAELKIRLLEEQQRADRLSQLYDKSRKQLTQIEVDLSRATTLNSELRDQLIQLHQTLTNEMKSQNLQQTDIEEMLREYQKRIDTLQLENRNLKQINDISREEAQMHYTINSLKTVELDSLRHQILDLQAISEDKETIARLGFELTNCRSLETELRKKKELLENDLSHLKEEIEESKKSTEEMRKQMQQCREQCNNRCKSYIEMIRFLQQQYAGSTSTTAWERYELNLSKLLSEHLEFNKNAQETKEEHDKVKLQQEVLSNRLQIVERLKDMLEQQIGSPDVERIMQRFSEESQRTLNDFKYKRQISHLEYELQTANKKLVEYEVTVTSMEIEMLNMQKVWKKKVEREEKNITQLVESEVLIPEQDKEIAKKQIELEKPERDTEIPKQVDSEYVKVAQEKEIEKSKKDTVQKKTEIMSNSTQTEIVDNCSVEVQCELNLRYTETNTKMIKECNTEQNKKQIEKDDNIHAFHNEQLNKALALASERSVMILKYESQLAEFQAKINSLITAIEEKDTKLLDRDKIIEQLKSDSNVSNIDGTDKIALKSTINSLQKLVNQKEETIARYQMLLKEDRDEHSRAASSLQEEIKHLQEKIVALEKELEERQVFEFPERDEKPEKQDTAKENLNKDFESSVETARLQEKIAMLEADLKAAKELGQRWQQLAEERLNHTDDMRSRLEEQHKLELESYRLELHKWQCETVSLRKQFSESRIQLAKENITMTKDLQEKENKIQELSVMCQQLQNELEVMRTIANVQQTTTYDVREPKMCETVHNSSREQAINQSQSQLDCLRRQLQTLLDKERMYKNQIADLKQQLSRRYMATKTQEKKTSQRELQLDRKVKSLEEELQKTKEQLNRESLVHEVKKAKTAEELALWEKQKKWQQMAEKLKEKLKEKTEELQKLQTNHEKLRSIVSCMEREKWYLRSKLKLEKSGMSAGFAFYPSVSNVEYNIVEDLQKECDLLKRRVHELTEERLAKDDTDQLRDKIEEQKRRISALEAVNEGNAYVVSQLEKLESVKDTLEKTNLRLESENFELRLELEKANLDTPRLREKIEHLEKYVEILKVEKLSESIPSSTERLSQESSSKKSIPELEKTIFVLKRIVEKLQAENKRLKSKNCHRITQMEKSTSGNNDSSLRKQYELAKQRLVSLETDLQLAEHRIVMLENSQKSSEDNNDEVSELKQQVAHKSELLDKVKILLTRAAINEKALRQKVQHLEMRQTLSTIPECYVTPTDTN